MRALSALLVVLLLGVPASAQISNRTWATVLGTPMGKYLSPDPITPKLTKAQAAALRRFVLAEYRKYPDFYNATRSDIWSDPDKLRIVPLGSELPNIFVVSPTPHDKNPIWWLLRFDSQRVINLSPLSKDLASRQVDFSDGYISILKPVHHGLRDLAVTETSGASELDDTYLQFDGTRYHQIASQRFKTCDLTPGHANTDGDHWCTSNGTIIANRQ